MRVTKGGGMKYQSQIFEIICQYEIENSTIVHAKKRLAEYIEDKSQILKAYRDAGEELPEKESPEQARDEGWNYAEQVGRNQAIDDCRPILAKAIYTVDSIGKALNKAVEETYLMVEENERLKKEVVHWKKLSTQAIAGKLNKPQPTQQELAKMYKAVVDGE